MVIFVWVFGVSLVVWGVFKVMMGICVFEEEEMEGMDMYDCGVGVYLEFVIVK